MKEGMKKGETEGRRNGGDGGLEVLGRRCPAHLHAHAHTSTRTHATLLKNAPLSYMHSKWSITALRSSGGNLCLCLCYEVCDMRCDPHVCLMEHAAIVFLYVHSLGELLDDSISLSEYRLSS